MNETWQAFVEKQSPNGNNEKLSISDLQEHDWLTALSHQGLLRLSGKDVAGFLQGQTTNDINTVSEGQSQLTALCSVQGKTLVILRVLRWRGDLYLCHFPLELAESIQNRLQPYILRADVHIENCSNEFAQLGISGPRAERILGLSFPGPLPTAANEVISHDTFTIIRMPGPIPRFALWGEVSALIPLWEILSEHIESMDSCHWRLLDILAGLPSVDLSTTNSFVPQMLNLDALGAISFSKGCYTGQEIVARAQHLGTVKRRIFLAQVCSGRRPACGESLYNGDGHGVGRVLNAETIGDELNLMLVVLQLAAVEEEIHLEGPKGTILRIQSLPYPLLT